MEGSHPDCRVMPQVLINITAVLGLMVVLVSCRGSGLTQGTPSAAAVADFLRVACDDPAVHQSLDRAGQFPSGALSSTCLSDDTQALFSSLEEMAAGAESASRLADRLRTEFRSVPLDFDWASFSDASPGSGLHVQEADTCVPQTGAVRLWVAVSPTIRNPYAAPVDSRGFFAEVEVESCSGLIVERFSYWIGAGEQTGSDRPVVTQVVRVATGLDNITAERVRLLP